MSNKLTREVKYLQESDRPKKVEPLSFTEWMKEEWHEKNPLNGWSDSGINNRVSEYATYLQEFSAEEVPVKLIEYHNRGEFGKSGCVPHDYDEIIYIGKCKSEGDMFKAIKRGTFTIYYGNLNSGRY